MSRDLPRNPEAFTAPQAFWAEAEELGRALLNQLDYFEALGVTELPPELAPPAQAPRPGPATGAGRKSSAPSGAAKTQTPEAERPQSRKQRAVVRPAPAPADWAAQEIDPAGLNDKIARCQSCPMAENRQAPPYPGSGSLSPLMLFVGPDPSIFEGPKGELLKGMIEKGLKLPPSEYYVTSLLKCGLAEEASPPSGADERCFSILTRQISLLKPKLVLALGRIPGQWLSGSREPLGLMRPKTFLVPGLEKSWLRVTYGLEDILDSPAIKAEAWKDLKKIIPGLDKLRAAL